ncbi:MULTISPECIES: 3-oxoacyl-ACP synthase III family protein [unclassified Streptomyces]|uniref:3-oxoacyl-ACP synthase III family protein n=1 Tax=Streptomyces sp. NRRL F-4428 TaxID=1609137 RepID=UPI0005EC7671|nr:ketoacyl-ACP synthase III [Streptomyces sp. NRRL F-4428]KJK49634.1 3-oxoacyl-ACP synthase [Streptomyces sp. NRRL F-4428]
MFIEPCDPPRSAGPTAVGSFLPAEVVSSEALQGEVARRSGLALPPRLLTQATGIVSRRVAGEGVYASTLAVGAARRALDSAALSPLDIDLLLFASASRDMVEPATAHIVQAELGSRAHALDVTNACNSFVNGIDLARSMILAGRARRALVVTGETPSRAVRKDPSGPAELRDAFAGYTFGDAGAAVVVEAVERGGILYVDTETHSEHWEVGGIPGGGSRHPRGDAYTYFRGDGHELRGVFEKVGTAVIDRTLHRTGMSWDGFAKVLVHQVTVPYLERFAELTGVPADKLVVTVPELGNIASASIGVQLDRVFPQLAPGERVLFVGLGGGISIMTMVWEKS